MGSKLAELLEIAQERPETGRSLLFRHACDLFIHGPLPRNESDHQALVEILRILRPRVDISVRREISGHLYSMTRPPEPLLRLLLEDEEEVAGPLIDYAALPEALMRDVAARGPEALRQRLGRRSDLPDTLRAMLTAGATPAPSPAPDQAPPQPAAVSTGLAPVPDIGRLVAATEAAQVRQARYKDYARAISDWQWECDRDGRITYLSDNAAWVFGRPPSALCGDFFTELLVRAGQDSAPDAFPRCLDRWRVFDRIPVRARHKASGDKLWLLSGVPVFDLDSGRFMGFRGAGRMAPQFTAASKTPARNDNDRTPRQPAQPAAAGTLTDHAVTDLLQGLSHELKTPLNAILGFSEMMAMGTWGPVNTSYQECVQRVLMAGQQIDDLVNDILEGAGTPPESSSPRLKPASATQIIKAAIDRVQRTANRHDITLEVAPQPFQILVVTDPVISERCLVRLLRCAIIESAKGSRLSIRTASRVDGGADIHVPIEPDPGNSKPLAPSYAVLRSYRLDQARELAAGLGGSVRDITSGQPSLILSFAPNDSVATHARSSASGSNFPA